MEHVYKSYETPESEINRDKPEMNVMLFSSQEYFDYIYVVMCSLIENNPKVRVHLFIVSFVELVGKEGLNDFIESRGDEITYYVLDKNIVAPFSEGKAVTRTGLGGMIRPIAHTFIEEKYDRMLFMDADMVVLGDIYTEFYNLDFEDKYLITTANSFDWEKNNNLTPENMDYDSAVNGVYFNSGLLVLNLKKLRTDISYEKVLETFKNDIKIRNEQSLLNVLIASNTKYVSPCIYHARWGFLYKMTEEERQKIRLFHYDPIYVPFKPWDIVFEDESYKKIKEVPTKPINSIYRPYVINEVTNKYLKLWWDYAKKTPKYEQFYIRMSHIREYFSAYVINMLNRYNKESDELEKLRSNVDIDEVNQIINIEKKSGTWLNAINTYYGLPLYDYSCEGIDYDVTTLNEYMEGMLGNSDVVILITSSITSHHIMKKFSVKDKLGLSITPKLNESYLAIIDFAKNTVIERISVGFITQRYSIDLKHDKEIRIEANGISMDISRDKTTVPVLLKSEGYNAKTYNSCNSILVNNINYAQTIKGLNIVVFCKSREKVVDAFYVDNGNLVIKR